MHGARRAVAILLGNPVHPPFRRHLEVPVARHQIVLPRHILLLRWRAAPHPNPLPASGEREGPPAQREGEGQLPVTTLRARIALVRQAPGSTPGILRTRCISFPAPRRDAVAPIRWAGSPTRGTPRGRGRRNCRSRSRSAPSSYAADLVQQI